MSCILTISGKNFDVDAFIGATKLRPYRKSYKGNLKFKNKPDGEKLSFSSISFETSKANFDNLKKQIEDTIRFLKRNKYKLLHITFTKGIDHAILNFGIDLRIDRKNIFIQSDIFPTLLLKLAGEVSLDIELSIYPNDLETILKKRYRKTKN
ncbi:MAG: hypothetical protein ABIY35_08585 [Chitinophagaceae bacterium]